jgi:sec-independent protein translocase protein TatA
MVPTVPAFGGVPGGPELLILLLILAIFVVVPAVAVAGVVLLVRLSSDDARADTDRIAELEEEVERLREKVEDDPGERDGGDRL